MVDRVIEDDGSSSSVVGSSRKERLTQSRVGLEFWCADKTISAFQVGVRRGVTRTYPAHPQPDGVTATLPFVAIAEPGTYDIHAVTRSGERRRFGRSIAKDCTGDRDRLLSIRQHFGGRDATWTAAYITFGRNGISCISAKSRHEILDKLFGVVSNSVESIGVIDDAVHLRGTFNIPGASDEGMSVQIGCAFEHHRLSLRFQAELQSSRGDAQETGALLTVPYLAKLSISELMESWPVECEIATLFLLVTNDGQVWRRRLFAANAAETVLQNARPGISLSVEPDGDQQQLAIRRTPAAIEVMNVDTLSKRGGNRLEVGGYVTVAGVDSSLVSVRLLASARGTSATKTFDTVRVSRPEIAERLAVDGGDHRMCGFAVEIATDDLVSAGLFAERFIDLFILVSFSGFTHKARLRTIDSHLASCAGEDVVLFKRAYRGDDIIAYVTRLDTAISLSFREHLPEESVLGDLKEGFAIALDAILPRLAKETWLLYETNSSTAQDNSFYFFKWLRETKPSINAYYVIRAGSPDRAKLNFAGSRVVDFFSLRHLFLLLRSTLLVSSQSRFHAYKFRPLRSRIKSRLVGTKLVFLQHGVTAFKRSKFSRLDPSGGAHLVIAVSEAEKKIICKNWDYPPSMVEVTGFARFDHLVDKSGSDKRVVMVMPTWRSWLEGISDEEFVSSAYFQNYKDLVEQLDKALPPDLEIVFCLHIKLAAYANQWTNSSSRVTFFDPRKEALNEVMMRSNLLVTDYSSVAWDMLYMGKPTIFYQFDRDTYLRRTGSFVDFDRELFGPAVFRASDVVKAVGKLLSNPSRLDPSQFFGFSDRNNCARIYSAIVKRFS